MSAVELCDTASRHHAQSAVAFAMYRAAELLCAVRRSPHQTKTLPYLAAAHACTRRRKRSLCGSSMQSDKLTTMCSGPQTIGGCFKYVTTNKSTSQAFSLLSPGRTAAVRLQPFDECASQPHAAKNTTGLVLLYIRQRDRRVDESGRHSYSSPQGPAATKMSATRRAERASQQTYGTYKSPHLMQ